MLIIGSLWNAHLVPSFVFLYPMSQVSESSYELLFSYCTESLYALPHTFSY